MLSLDMDYKVHARIHRVAQVIHPVDLDHIYILRVEPVAGPRAAECKPITAVLEAATSEIVLADAKRVLASEVGLVTVGGNAASARVLGRFSLWCALLRAFLLRLGVLFFLSGFRLWLRGFLRLRLLLSRFVFLFLLLFVRVLRVCQTRRA